MFAPTRTWRRWHRKVNTNQKRFAVASGLAASAVAPLVYARGHRIDKVPEIPLVIANEAVETIESAKKALAFLKIIGAADDVIKVKDSKNLRAGKGKFRNRRYTMSRGPLIIHNLSGVVPLTRSFRNLPGIEFCRVQELNPLLLSPGGHLGRFIIWTKSAFEQLDDVFGTQRHGSRMKNNYHLPRSVLSNDDITRVIQSDQVQNILRLKKGQNHTRLERKKNPFKHPSALARLDPYAAERKAVQAEKVKKILEVKAVKEAAKKAGTYKPDPKPKKVSRSKEKIAVRKHLFGA